MYAIYFVLFLTVFLIGLSVGSFINVLVDRLPAKKDVIKDRSRCNHCGHKLTFSDLVPLLSYLFLKGKCRYCKKPIDEIYPFTELATGTLFVFSLLRFVDQVDVYSFQSVLTYNSIAIVTGLLLSIFIFFAVYDIKYYEVSDKVIFPVIGGLTVANIILLLYSKITGTELLVGGLEINPIQNILAGLLSVLLIIIIILITKGKGMGGGDIRVAAMIGLMAGFKGTFIAFYLSFVVGALAGLIYATIKGKLKGLEIPFVPFLAFGGVAGFLFGKEIFSFLFPLL